LGLSHIFETVAIKATKLDKCSAVAEMGDRLAKIDMAENWGEGLCPLWERELCPLWKRELGLHVTQCSLGRGLPSYQVAS